MIINADLIEIYIILHQTEGKQMQKSTNQREMQQNPLFIFHSLELNLIFKRILRNEDILKM